MGLNHAMAMTQRASFCGPCGDCNHNSAIPDGWGYDTQDQDFFINTPPQCF